jgi:hypothetical protein
MRIDLDPFLLAGPQIAGNLALDLDPSPPASAPVKIDSLAPLNTKTALGQVQYSKSVLFQSYSFNIFRTKCRNPDPERFGSDLFTYKFV